MAIKRGNGEKAFDVINVIFMILLMFITLYPLLYVAFASISSPSLLIRHRGLLLSPLGFELGAYKAVFDNPMISKGYINTIFIVVAGTMVNIVMTSLGAYVLSRKGVYWKKVFMFIIVVTMFFGGGMIPTYLLVKQLKLTDTLWSLIIPNALSTYNMIIMRTSFMSIPDSLEESARIDGAKDFTILFQIVLPLSMPVIAVMILFYGVGHWNSWFSAMIYLRDRELYPLQLILREILIASSLDNMMTDTVVVDREPVGQTIKYATIIVATLPILCIYPFLQKYFVKGIMIGAGIQLNPALNEYGFLREAISNTLDEKEIIEQKLKRQNKALRSGFLARLIKGTSDQVVPIDEALSSYGVQWIGDSFCVILIYMDDFKRLFDGAPSSNPIGQLKLVQFIITNIVEELIGRKYKGFVTEVDDMMACLVNMDDKNGEHMEEQPGKQEYPGKNELIDIMKEAQRIIRENFYVHLTISIGNTHRTVAGIPQSYQEAQEAMEYRMVMGSERIICYDEIKNPENRYDYPLELEQQLINSVRTGDFQTAKEITNDVFQRHFSGEMISVEITKCLLFDLMGTIIKVLKDINIPQSSAFIEELKPIARISSSDTVMEMKYEMMDILKKVCEYIDCSKKDRNQNITEKIIAIIHTDYSDANLCISNIAGEFGLTGPYVSKIFRDHMGEGIQDYMNKVRLNQAKVLLMEKHENLDKIAKAVGYTNSNGLIRVFKKYEGLTPGQFREMNR